MINLPIPARNSQADQLAILGLIAQLETSLPALLTLTDAERKSARRLGQNNFTLAERVAELGARFPVFFTLGHNVTEMRENFGQMEDLTAVVDAVSGILKKLADTLLVIEDRQFHIAHSYNHSALDGLRENVPSADYVVDELSGFFENFGPRPADEDAPDSNAPDSNSPNNNGGTNGGEAGAITP